jgi:hypothetical protein
VVPEDGGVSWSHAGALEDTCASWLGRTPDGLGLAFVTNTLPPIGDIGTFFPEVIGALLAAARQVARVAVADVRSRRRIRDRLA